MTRLIRRSFTLSEKDVATLKMITERCGFVTESEALRAAIKFYAEHASCVKQP
jgi:hypothetical protein